eukprot:2023791-Amphidinium_carterae.1
MRLVQEDAFRTRLPNYTSKSCTALDDHKSVLDMNVLAVPVTSWCLGHPKTVGKHQGLNVMRYALTRLALCTALPDNSAKVYSDYNDSVPKRYQIQLESFLGFLLPWTAFGNSLH